jgi:hypothetical protein
MRSLLLTALLTASLSGFAAAQKPQKGGDDSAGKAATPLRNPIPLYETRDHFGYCLGVRADLLYMNYNSPVLTYAADRSIEGAVPATLRSTILGVPGEMSLGCNLALSYKMNNQPGYAFDTSWYYMDVHFSDRNSGSNVLLAHSVALTTGAPGFVDVKAHLLINFFDLMIHKQFAFGDWFRIAPATGLVGGFMHSQCRARTQATSGSFGNSTTAAALNQFIQYEGIGMKFGAKSSFKIWRGFRLTSDFFYSVLYGYTTANLEYSSNGNLNGFSGANSVYRHHHGRSFVDSLLGLAWETTFRNDSLYLDLHAGWRFQYFSSGWMEYEAEFNDAVQNLPLLGQGLQVGATFKF